MPQLTRILTCITFFVLVTVNVFAQQDGNLHHFPADEKTIVLTRWKYRLGDQLLWAAPEFDDKHWKNHDLHDAKGTAPRGIRWYRTYIRIAALPKQDDFVTLYFRGLLSAYEIYWDGQMILENGEVAGKAENETPGLFRNTIKLRPEQASVGQHVLAIRLSNDAHQQENALSMVALGYHDVLQRGMFQFYLFQAINGSLFLMTAVFCMAAFWGGGHHRGYLLFALYCLNGLIDIIVTVTIDYSSINIAYLQYWRGFYNTVTPLSVILITLFLVRNYDIPRQKLHISVSAILTILITILLGRLYAAVMSFYGLGLLIYAVRQKKPGAAAALTGFLVSDTLILMYLFGYIYYSYAIGMTFFMFCMMLSISMQVRAETRTHQRAVLRSTRLETELLKKQIQPHFLMNTLLSIISWMEKQPARAKAMIEALADEFRLVNNVAEKSLIPIEDEIQLCRAHLDIMENRRNARYSLNTGALPEGEMVPPMIFHTLIENGLTHSFRPGEHGEFELSCFRQNGRLHYRIQNNGSLLGKLLQKPQDRLEEGLGLKYVKLRLAESFPGKWSLSYGIRNSFWTVDILIDK